MNGCSNNDCNQVSSADDAGAKHKIQGARQNEPKPRDALDLRYRHASPEAEIDYSTHRGMKRWFQQPRQADPWNGLHASQNDTQVEKKLNGTETARPASSAHSKAATAQKSALRASQTILSTRSSSRQDALENRRWSGTREDPATLRGLRADEDIAFVGFATRMKE